MSPEYEGDEEVDLGPDWTGEWLEIDLELIAAVITDLLDDMDAGEYF